MPASHSWSVETVPNLLRDAVGPVWSHGSPCCWKGSFPGAAACGKLQRCSSSDLQIKSASSRVPHSSQRPAGLESIMSWASACANLRLALGFIRGPIRTNPPKCVASQGRRRTRRPMASHLLETFGQVSQSLQEDTHSCYRFLCSRP